MSQVYDPVKAGVQQRIDAAAAKRAVLQTWLDGLLAVVEKDAGKVEIGDAIGLIPIPGADLAGLFVQGVIDTESGEAKEKAYRERLGSELWTWRTKNTEMTDPARKRVKSMFNNSPFWERARGEANEVNAKFTGLIISY